MSVVTLAQEHPTARKEHRCDDCGRAIQPGETYERQRNIGDDGPYVWKSCAHCQVIVDWVFAKEPDRIYDDLGFCVADWISDYGREMPELYAQYRNGFKDIAPAELALPPAAALLGEEKP